MTVIAPSTTPVFADESGRRVVIFRTAAWALCLCLTVLGGAIVFALATGVRLPALRHLFPPSISTSAPPPSAGTTKSDQMSTVRSDPGPALGPALAEVGDAAASTPAASVPLSRRSALVPSDDRRAAHTAPGNTPGNSSDAQATASPPSGHVSGHGGAAGGGPTPPRTGNRHDPAAHPRPRPSTAPNGQPSTRANTRAAALGSPGQGSNAASGPATGRSTSTRPSSSRTTGSPAPATSDSTK